MVLPKMPHSPMIQVAVGASQKNGCWWFVGPVIFGFVAAVVK